VRGLGLHLDPPRQLRQRRPQGPGGLRPDTTYAYRAGGVGEGGALAFTEARRFHTAPDLGVDPAAQVTLLVLGDTRGGYDTFGKLLAKGAELAAPDLILSTGDAVTLGPIEAEWGEWLDAASPVLAEVPVVVANDSPEDVAELTGGIRPSSPKTSRPTPARRGVWPCTISPCGPRPSCTARAPRCRRRGGRSTTPPWSTWC
jgi:hypothetical protein